MVGIVNSPHTRKMTPLRTRISTTLFQFILSHRPGPSLLDPSEVLEFPTQTVSLIEAFNKLSTDAVCFVAIFATPSTAPRAAMNVHRIRFDKLIKTEHAYFSLAQADIAIF